MAKIKLTKSELKTQRDSLKQFQRFLPTLQLKKQQLQLEIAKSREHLKALDREEKTFFAELDQWSALFGDATPIPFLEDAVEIEELRQGTLNIAGVAVPTFEKVTFRRQSIDLYETDPWMDDALVALERVFEFKIRRLIFEEQYRLLSHELNVTSQRVNLFEKVKIPECRENIRVIQIALGDEQTAAVVRSKIAKRKLTEATA